MSNPIIANVSFLVVCLTVAGAFLYFAGPFVNIAFVYHNILLKKEIVAALHLHIIKFS